MRARVEGVPLEGEQDIASPLGSMLGKTCLITGASSGIGEAAAGAIAGLGAHVVLVGREPSRCRATVQRIRARHPSASVETLVAELGHMEGWTGLAREFLERHDRLDVLVNNAGAIFYDRRLNRDGVERTLALNHLAYFGLTCLLVDSLTKSAPSRVVNVASGAHWRGRLAFDDLGMEAHWNGYRAYAQSKLANILFTRELARRLAGTGVTANSLHPGNVSTRFGSNNRTPMGWLTALFLNCFGIGPDVGARTVVYLASSPEAEGITGGYFYQCRDRHLSPDAQDDQTALRLWEVSEALTGLRFPPSGPAA